MSARKKPVAGRGRTYLPTDEDRHEVQLMTAWGLDPEQIGHVMGISRMTVKRHFKPEIKNSLSTTVKKVAGRLYAEAMKGNMTAAIFLLKCRAGWRENASLELTGPGGAPLGAGIAVIELPRNNRLDGPEPPADA